MASYYSIVQYVPDPVADERLNVGVIAFGDGVIRSKFIRNWSRPRMFGNEDVSFLKQFAADVATWTSPQIVIPGLDEGVRLTPEGFRRLAGTWINSIQFTEPKASLLPPDQALMAASRFLREPPIKHRGFRDRRAAVGLAFRGLHEALVERAGPKAGGALDKNYKVQGSLDEHRFDLAIHNGKPLLAAHCLSFEGPANRDLEQEIDAAAWSIDDVLAAYPLLSIGVITLAPKGKSKTYDRAVHVFQGLKATVVTEDQVTEWATKTSVTVADAL